MYALALNYLAIQASSVPSERAFSSAAETDTARRNRISPILMEALQMLKYSLKNMSMNFMSGVMVAEDDLHRSRSAHDLLSLITSSSITAEDQEDAMDSILRAIET